MEVTETVRLRRRKQLILVTIANPCDCRYWQFLLYLFIILTICELVLAPMRPIYSSYSSMIGYVGLTVEAMLPLPQIFANARSKSCKGFRLSVLASWLLGDSMKMFWFFTSPTEIPWAFKLCGIFQACCDAYLGIQYWMYGDGEGVLKDHAPASWPAQRAANGRWLPRTPSGMRVPTVEKEI